MSIVKMKKFRMLAMRDEKEKLIKELHRLGCMQINEHEADDEDIKRLSLVRGDSSRLLEYKDSMTRVSAALKLLDKYAYVKTGLFPVLPEVELSSLFDDELPKRAEAFLRDIEENDNKLSSLYAALAKAKSDRLSLELWRETDIDLSAGDTENVCISFITVSSLKSFEELSQAVLKITDEAQLIEAGSDKEQRGAVLIYHKSHGEEINEALREFGFSRVSFAGMSGSAKENTARLDGEIEKIEKETQLCLERLSALGSSRDCLKLYYDRLTQEVESEQVKSSFLMSEKVFLLEGWVVSSQLKRLEELLEKYCCAYESRDPEPDEEVPVQLKNNALTRPLNMVTEMYSLPKYRNVDPNPLIMFWFCAFFGIMYADAGYGLVLLLLGLIVRPRIKKPGTLKYAAGLLIECGISTFVFGWLFGSFFGDSLNYFPAFFGYRIDMSVVPLWGIKDPNTDPMWFMYASLAVGALHLLAGMLIKAYILIRDRHPLAALFDVGSWLLLFAGIGVGALKGSWWVALAGAAALVLTQGRSSPTIIGKAVGGFKSLYDITSWLGDILSYTRLMALMLAGSVIAQVFNMLGNMAGGAVPSKILGLLVFLLIFVVTQLFNMAINIIGTFVHAARLQYLEFFGKFYEDGGKPFKPFKIKTKYTEIVKEEN